LSGGARCEFRWASKASCAAPGARPAIIRFFPTVTAAKRAAASTRSTRDRNWGCAVHAGGQRLNFDLIVPALEE
jgi:hypothetical protein